jgi:hypothetical protein
MATLRSGAGVPPGFRATGNPGGPGHQWVKSRYIDPAPGGNKVIVDPDTGLKRIYIPSRVTDNAYLGADYIQRLKASGSEALVRAWLDGDWTVIEGAFFPEFTFERHVLRPFPVPADWMRFQSIDWGSASPFSVGWWAVASDAYSVDDHLLPRGAIVRYREWYGASKPNVGLKMTGAEVTAGILHRERNDPRLAYRVLDPACWNVNSGPSIAEEMARAGLYALRKAENKRTAEHGHMSGWDQLRNRLIGDADGNPTIFFFDTCAALIRTLPALQHDADKPEDVDSESEDHACDECRYACMSRPFARSPSLAEKRRPLMAVGPSNEIRFRDLLTQDEWDSKYGRRRRERI